MMEKKKIDAYNAGYKAPEPVDFGRWYERVTQDDIDEFNRREDEHRSNWAEPGNVNRESSYSDDYLGIMGGVCFGRRRKQETEKKEDET